MSKFMIFNLIIATILFSLLMFLFTKIPSDKVIANSIGTFIGEIEQAKNNVNK